MVIVVDVVLFGPGISQFVVPVLRRQMTTSFDKPAFYVTGIQMNKYGIIMTDMKEIRNCAGHCHNLKIAYASFIYFVSGIMTRELDFSGNFHGNETYCIKILDKVPTTQKSL